MEKNFFKKLRDLKSVKTYKSEYLNWLLLANAGSLHKGNVYCFDYVIQNLTSTNPVIEIGSFCGLSTNVLSYLLIKYNRKNKIICCDNFDFENLNGDETIGESKILQSDYRNFVINSFKRNVSFFSKDKLPYLIQTSSDKFFDLWNSEKITSDIFDREIKIGGDISFAYIDGNHKYEFAKRDFLNISKHLEKGGFILFDDSSDYSQFECAKLMEEIINNTDYKLIMKNPHYLFKKIK